MSDEVDPTHGQVVLISPYRITTRAGKVVSIEMGLVLATRNARGQYVERITLTYATRKDANRARKAFLQLEHAVVVGTEREFSLIGMALELVSPNTRVGTSLVDKG